MYIDRFLRNLNGNLVDTILEPIVSVVSAFGITPAYYTNLSAFYYEPA